MRLTPFLGRTLCATSTPVRTLCAAFVLATACLLPAFAQPYPARPVSFILPVPPGGALDILARALGQQFALRNGGAQILIDKGAPAAALELLDRLPGGGPSPTRTSAAEMAADARDAEQRVLVLGVQDLVRLAGPIDSRSDDGIRGLMELHREIGKRCDDLGHARFEEGSEHFFAYCFEFVTGRTIMHGELVCLGVLVMSAIQGNRPEIGRAHV